MARYSYERLSAQDASFLWAEKPNQPMHVGAVAILEAGPLKSKTGGIDIKLYRAAVEAVLHWIPRYRQKLAWVPVEGWPVWVDDRRFDLGYHIRHIALPKPGGLEQLKEMAARINARPLDRERPLWEIWVIEGVGGGEQFAVLNKIHHCMIDGAAGADLARILMSPSPRVEANDPVPYMPRPAPTPAELLSDSLGRALVRPIEFFRGAAFGAAEGSAPDDVGLAPRLRALRDLLGYVIRPASDTPINGELGTHRRLEWLTMPLEGVREIRDVLGCTVNDVVLATVCGAMRRYLFRRRVDTRKIEFRVAAPVSTRRPEDDRRQGNHVSTWIVPLPLDVDDPLEQVSIIRQRTRELKSTRADLGVDTLMRAAEWLPAPVLARVTALASGPANMIVTNVPGPQFPLYMVGARLLGLYPLVPLLPGGGLGVALFSYEDKLCWGFNGDYEIVPDLPAFVEDVRIAFEHLRQATVSHFMAKRTGEVEIPRKAPAENLERRRKVRVEPTEAKHTSPSNAERTPPPGVVPVESERPRSTVRSG